MSWLSVTGYAVIAILKRRAIILNVLWSHCNPALNKISYHYRAYEPEFFRTSYWYMSTLTWHVFSYTTIELSLKCVKINVTGLQIYLYTNQRGMNYDVTSILSRKTRFSYGNANMCMAFHTLIFKAWMDFSYNNMYLNVINIIMTMLLIALRQLNPTENIICNCQYESSKILVV